MDHKNNDSPIIYICSKYSGDVEHNTEMARRYCRYAVDRGFVPLAPHLLLPQFLSEKRERALAIQIDLRLLALCQELWVCGDEISDGMMREIDRATDLGMTMKHIREEDLNVRN